MRTSVTLPYSSIVRIALTWPFSMCARIASRGNVGGSRFVHETPGRIAGFGGAGGALTTGGAGGNNQGGTECIETDPVQSGLSTPLNPVILTSPIDQANGTLASVAKPSPAMIFHDRPARNST